MEQTRKLLLLAETDPKAFDVPLVGVWVAGVADLHDPYVWAACARFAALPDDVAQVRARARARARASPSPSPNPKRASGLARLPGG